MERRNTEVTTQELWAKLFQAPSYDIYAAEHTAELPAFSDYITELCRLRQAKPEQILRNANIESSFGHRLFSGVRNPSRDTVLKIAFGFGMETEETQTLLKIARMSLLHPKVRRDAVIAWCLHNHKSLLETQEILHDNELPLMGGTRDA